MVSKAVPLLLNRRTNITHGFINYDRLLALVFAGGLKTDLKMKTYYAECTVSFTDNSEEEPWKSSETYSYIIEANNKKEGKVDAEKQAKEELERELGKMDDVKVVIDTFYATFEGAMAN